MILGGILVAGAVLLIVAMAASLIVGIFMMCGIFQ